MYFFDYTTATGHRVTQVNVFAFSMQIRKDGATVHRVAKITNAQADEYVRTGKIANL